MRASRVEGSEHMPPYSRVISTTCRLSLVLSCTPSRKEFGRLWPVAAPRVPDAPFPPEQDRGKVLNLVFTMAFVPEYLPFLCATSIPSMLETPEKTAKNYERWAGHTSLGGKHPLVSSSPGMVPIPFRGCSSRELLGMRPGGAGVLGATR